MGGVGFLMTLTMSSGFYADCKPRANNRHWKGRIGNPVLRYGWVDHGGW
jgi:hypothetical protein